MGKALVDFTHPETPKSPAEAYWEVKYGKEKSSTKLDQHLLYNHRDIWKKHEVETLTSEETKCTTVKGPMDSFISHSDDYFVENYLRWIVEKALPINTGRDLFFPEL